jgi:PAS domain-containing protein
VGWPRRTRRLVASHNALGDALREQRLSLVQRELLLDTMVQNTPVAMVLVDPSRRVVHANIAARKLLGEGHKLEGQDFDALLALTPKPCAKPSNAAATACSPSAT